MPCTTIVGGQYGSEGKGKVLTAILKRTHDENPYLVRCGGPNAGHTHQIDGEEVIFRQVPASDHPGATMFIAAGSVVNPKILLRELELLDFPRIYVDSHAAIISQDDIDKETELMQEIGSTGSGVGSAMARRIMGDITSPACNCEALKGIPNVVVAKVALTLHQKLDVEGHVIVEGTQGFGLSLYHGEYPYVTAKDTTVCNFASEAGLALSQMRDNVVVIRTFPIRVGGNSGPLKDEVDWEAVARLGGAPEVELEYTSVTKKIRRVGLFDTNMVERACWMNGATRIALMGADRLYYQDRGKRYFEELHHTTKEFIRAIETKTKVLVQWIGTGPGSDDIIDRNP